MKTCQTAQKLIIGIDTFSWLPLSPRNLGRFKLWSDRSDHSCSYLILQIKNVFDFTVEPIGPAVPIAASISCPVIRMRLLALRTLPSST